MTTEDTLLVIRGHQERLNEWDDLLAHHAMAVASISRAKKPPKDWTKLRLFKREKQAGEPKVKEDTEYAGAWLAAIKARQKRS